MITSEEQLRSLYAMPAERALLKQQVDLDRHCLRFIALSPLCIVATGGGAGAMMDASPRGGKPGFIKAPDNQTLLIPDSGGNNRLDSFSNLIADPRIGLLFMVPGFDETLRVNGVAKLRDEGKSLLPIGMVNVDGEFARGDVIAVRDALGIEVARGLANYASAEARLLCRKSSVEIERLLGYSAGPEMVHRDNMVIAGH